MRPPLLSLPSMSSAGAAAALLGLHCTRTAHSPPPRAGAAPLSPCPILMAPAAACFQCVARVGISVSLRDFVAALALFSSSTFGPRTGTPDTYLERHCAVTISERVVTVMITYKKENRGRRIMAGMARAVLQLGIRLTLLLAWTGSTALCSFGSEFSSLAMVVDSSDPEQLRGVGWKPGKWTLLRKSPTLRKKEGFGQPWNKFMSLELPETDWQLGHDREQSVPACRLRLCVRHLENMRNDRGKGSLRLRGGWGGPNERYYELLGMLRYRFTRVSQRCPVLMGFDAARTQAHGFTVRERDQEGVSQASTQMAS